MEAHENPEVKEAVGRGAATLAAGSSNSNSHNGILGVRTDLGEILAQLARALPRMEEKQQSSG
jgi:hypothetical protein